MLHPCKCVAQLNATMWHYSQTTYSCLGLHGESIGFHNFDMARTNSGMTHVRILGAKVRRNNVWGEPVLSVMAAGCHYNEEEISWHLNKKNSILAGPI